MFKIILGLLMAYLLGSIPFGYLIGKYVYHKDIMQAGSGNIGTTNTFRVLGFIPGTIVFIFDVLKGTVGGLLAYLIWTPLPDNRHFLILAIGVVAVLGHTFSIWLNFKGGKGVASSLGILLAYSPKLFLISLCIFLICLILTSIVSISSLLNFFFSTLVFWYYDEKFLALVAAGLMVYVTYLHRSNLGRMIHGNENTIKFGIPYWIRRLKAK
ncbi:glycerol-3-phosphate 1-O-acyltransferase PlsY [Weissella coleopterorum]|uniref:Glycerol-3-phosphate acyltransferase n=1 Tax=Weissella coleopterorum TaxID=2714949 RepID=A0A6G8B201_9LACO|nr:glycerol-3-phosphate 1-O-acyltransferase PlsY [Weissella coleopterorum]